MIGLFATWLLVICGCNIKAFNAKESVMRFDGSQLWRLSDINNFELIRNLEDQYGKINYRFQLNEILDNKSSPT